MFHTLNTTEVKKVIGSIQKYLLPALNGSDFYLRLMIIAVFVQFFSSVCEAQTILSEDFADNHRNWEESTGERETSIVKSGKYYIKTNDTDIWHWFSTPIFLRDEKEWLIEADMFIDSAKTLDGFIGICWGAKDAENIFQAIYYPNTNYVTGKVIQKGKLQEIFQYTDIKIDSAQNLHFSLLKAHDSYWYLLNGIPIDKTKALSFFGNKVGFIVAGKTAISVDNFVIKELEQNSSTIAEIENAFSKISDKNGNVKRNWGYYQKLANSLLDKGDTINALIVIDKCDSAAKDEFYLLDTLEYWRHRNPVANFLIEVGEYKKSVTILKKCIEVFKSADSTKTSMYPVLLMNLGRSYSRMGNYSLALKYYREALELRKDLFGWKDGRTIKSAEDIIGVNAHSGETANSNDVYLEILEGLKKEVGMMNTKYLSKSDDYANYLIGMGRYSMALGRLKQTMAYRQQLFVDTPYRMIPSFHFIGKMYWEMDSLDSAEQYFYKANELAKKYSVNNWIPTTEVGLAEIYRLQGKYKEALKILIPYYKANKEQGSIWIANNLGSIYFDLGNYKKACQYYLEFEKFIDKNSNVYMLEKRQELIVLYNHLSETYHQLRNHSLAYVYSCLAMDIIFLELNGNKNILSESNYFSFLNKYHEKIAWFNCLASLQSHEFTSSKRIISDGEIFRINELFHLPKKISPENEYFKGLLYHNDSLISYMDTLNKKLSDENAAYVRIIKFPLFYENNGSGYMAIIKNGNYIHVFGERIDITATLDSIFLKKQMELISQKQSDLLEFKMFWSKIEPHLEGKKKIYLAPDGVFNKLNIETVLTQDSSGKCHYLGDQYAITIVNSSRDLFDVPFKADTLKTISLFGYPDYTLSKNEQARLSHNVIVDSTSLSFMRGSEGVTGNYIFKPLAATKHEVEEIGQDLWRKGWNVQIYTGERALEEQVKSCLNPRVLHIATHGFFAEDIKSDQQKRFMGMDSKEVMENPLLRSGLAFAGAERTRTDTIGSQLAGMDDGILTAEEAQYLKLDSTELVVLSACETGLGEIVNGEGIYGLQRAFRAAGAKSILMSLWKVDDIATETLMKGFYRHWLDDGMSKHDALWQAKLDLRNDKVHPEWAKPYYWGAFVLIGE